MGKNLFMADNEIIELHEKATRYNVAINGMVADANNGNPLYPIANCALWCLSADLLAFHRSVKCLCMNGWAFAATPLLRTMLDMLLNIALISWDAKDADYMGFKYLCFSLKGAIADPKESVQNIILYKKQIKQYLSILNPLDKLRAKEFIFKVRLYNYWYCPEYRRPSDAIKERASEGMDTIYDTLSSPTHGGYMGLKFFKDNISDVHPNPRSDKVSQNRVLLTSSRIIIEGSSLRATLEIPGQDKYYNQLVQEFQSMRRYLSLPQKPEHTK